jgi:hypothetical protein
MASNRGHFIHILPPLNMKWAESSASVLYLSKFYADINLTTQFYHIVNFFYLRSNIPLSPVYGTCIYISQLIQYATVHFAYDEYLNRDMEAAYITQLQFQPFLPLYDKIYISNCFLLHNTVTSNAYLLPHRYICYVIV